MLPNGFMLSSKGSMEDEVKFGLAVSACFRLATFLYFQSISTHDDETGLSVRDMRNGITLDLVADIRY